MIAVCLGVDLPCNPVLTTTHECLQCLHGGLDVGTPYLSLKLSSLLGGDGYWTELPPLECIR